MEFGKTLVIIEFSFKKLYPKEGALVKLPIVKVKPTLNNACICCVACVNLLSSWNLLKPYIYKCFEKRIILHIYYVSYILHGYIKPLTVT